MNNKRRLVPILTLSFFLLFLIAIYEVAKQAQADEATRTVVSITNGIQWVQLYPDWFFQVIYLSIAVTTAGLLFAVSQWWNVPARVGLLLSVELSAIASFAALVAYASLAIAMSGNLFAYVYIFGFTLHAYPIVIWFFFYLVFYRKFGWNSIPLFLFAQGLNENIFDAFYLITRSSTIPPPSAWYYNVVLLNLCFVIGSLIVLRPKIKFSFWTGYAPLGVLFAEYMVASFFPAIYPVTSPSQPYYNNFLVNGLDALHLTLFPLVVWTSLFPRGRPYSAIPLLKQVLPTSWRQS
ncbi:MAG: hypothetical protein JRN59_07510 [Nitrososphaerota archaeon]|nr:hypothetical protein [Nitrososphaerota archaeon]